MTSESPYYRAYKGGNDIILPKFLKHEFIRIVMRGKYLRIILIVLVKAQNVCICNLATQLWFKCFLHIEYNDFYFYLQRKKMIWDNVVTAIGEIPLQREWYSEACLKRICPRADICLKRTALIAPQSQFAGQILINLTRLKRTPVKSGQDYLSQRWSL